VRARAALLLAIIAALAVLVHGYHLGVDDAAIYVPAIKRVADPALYPFGAEFFMSHAHLSLFSGADRGFRAPEPFARRRGDLRLARRRHFSAAGGGMAVTGLLL